MLESWIDENSSIFIYNECPYKYRMYKITYKTLQNDSLNYKGLIIVDQHN